MQQVKTILEWLKQAKADGYEWADAAIRNCMRPNAITLTLRGAIMSGFTWEMTPEGLEYWHNVWKSLTA